MELRDLIETDSRHGSSQLLDGKRKPRALTSLKD